MEIVLLLVAAGLFALGCTRFFMFKYRMRNYSKTKSIVTNISIETRYFTAAGTEITRTVYEHYAPTRALYKNVSYYSPEITYEANDGQVYTGTWWTEMPGRLPYNIGEKIEIYYNPSNPPQFFLYDKMMMFYEPLLLAFIGGAGVVFFASVML